MALDSRTPVATVLISEEALRRFSKEFTVKQQRVPGENEHELRASLSNTLENFIGITYSFDTTPSHRAAATNAICSLLEYVKASIRPSSNGSALLEAAVWRRALAAIINRSDGTKGKLVRQVLAALLVVLPLYDSHQREHMSHDALSQVMNIIHSDTSSHGAVKTAFQVLAMLFSKDIINVRNLTDQLTSFGEQTSSPQLLQMFLSDLFDWVRHPEIASSAGQAICAFLKRVSERSASSTLKNVNLNLPSWVTAVEELVDSCPEALINLKNHVFPTLFSIDRQGYVDFLVHLGVPNISAVDKGPDGPCPGQTKVTHLLCTALQVGKESGLAVESPSARVEDFGLEGNLLRIPDTFLTPYLGHCESRNRIAGLSLIITSHATTMPFSKRALLSLKSNLSHLFFESDPYTRGEVLGLLQKLLDRIRAATLSLDNLLHQRHHKQISSRSTTSSEALGLEATHVENILQQHQDFLSWFLHFLLTQLHPAASYQRHVSALIVLVQFVRSGLDPSIDSTLLSKRAASEVKSRSVRLHIYDSWLKRALYDLLMDPFDDVRDSAALLLAMEPESSSSTIVSSRVTDTQGAEMRVPAQAIAFLIRAEQRMLLSGRADHADGISRTYALVFQRAAVDINYSQLPLETCADPRIWSKTRIRVMRYLIHKLEHIINAATDDFAQAVRRFPMHGILSSIRYIFESKDFYQEICKEQQEFQDLWRALHKRIIVALGRVWKCVAAVLCNDAPEGHIPTDFEDDMSVTTKDVLSYSWRALKEASALVRVIVSHAPIDARPVSGMIVKEDVETLSFLCFTQLAEIRHRGAFSSVAQAYARCCARAHKENCTELLSSLYLKTLLCIKNKDSISTRRSAGLPSLMTGILGADPGGTMFVRAMSDLQEQAQPSHHTDNLDVVQLSQVHALNSMKAIFTSSILGASSEPHIAAALDTAGQCLTSRNWSTLNCGLMLFRALIDRLLGSTDSQDWLELGESKGTRQTYKDFPNLLNIIVKLLAPGTGSLKPNGNSLERVFPALKILQRMPPPEARREEIRDLIVKLCGCAHWHVRDMAARTFSGLVPDEEVVGSILKLDLMATVQPSEFKPGFAFGMPQNTLHGRLLCVSYTVKRLIYEMDNQKSFRLKQRVFHHEEHLCQIYSHLLDVFEGVVIRNKCPFTRGIISTVCIDIETQAATHSSLRAKLEDLRTKYELVLSAIDEDQAHSILNGPLSVRVPVAGAIILHDALFPSSSKDEGTVKSQCSKYVPREFAAGLNSSDPVAFLEILKSTPGLVGKLTPDETRTTLPALWSLAKSNNNSNLQQEALHLLYRFYDERGRNGAIFPDSLSPSSFREAFNVDLVSSPDQTEALLRLWAPLIEEATHRRNWQPQLGPELRHLVSFFRLLLRRPPPFDFAPTIAQCLRDVPSMWSISSTQSDLRVILLRAIIITYDLLIHDDEETRHVGSEVASAILAAEVNGSDATDYRFAPLVSSQKVAGHLVRNYNSSFILCQEAIERMTGCKVYSNNSTLQPTAESRLDAALAEDTALFVIEKQNLFIDEVREAILWSQVLRKVSMEAITKNTANAVSEWTIQGLQVLLTAMKEQDVDGALGWCSKPKIFILFMQILCAADVIMSWRFQSRVIPIRGSEIRRLLVKLLVLAREKEVHQMLVERIEIVVFCAAKERVVLMGKTLGRVEEDFIGS